MMMMMIMMMMMKEAQLSLRARASYRVTEATGRSMSFEVTSLSMACVSLYSHSVVTVFLLFIFLRHSTSNNDVTFNCGLEVTVLL